VGWSAVVVQALAGCSICCTACCDTYESWTRSTDIAELPQLRDVLVRHGLRAATSAFYSNWQDGPRWQDFHLRELPRILEPYGAGSNGRSRGCRWAGSARWTTRPAARMFRAAASFSGVLHPLGVPRFWLGLFSQLQSDPTDGWG
jgi:S-formylglutathione hydrolase FrmB